jgi:molybdopterin-guanine dinucleotide biosynthesis protein A
VTQPFSAVVLAGGRSSRMGSPKALVEVEGIPLWLRQAAVLQSLRPAELVISAGSEWEPGKGPWKVVVDRSPGRGPLGGIDAALATMTTDYLLVLAVDMPAMLPEYLRTLVGLAGPKGVVPVDAGLYQGLAAVYPRSAGALVEEYLGGDDFSLQRFLRAAVAQGLMKAAPVSAAERPLFRNVNRPDDL